MTLERTDGNDRPAQPVNGTAKTAAYASACYAESVHTNSASFGKYGLQWKLRGGNRPPFLPSRLRRPGGRALCFSPSYLERWEVCVRLERKIFNFVAVWRQGLRKLEKGDQTKPLEQIRTRRV